MHLSGNVSCSAEEKVLVFPSDVISLMKFFLVSSNDAVNHLSSTFVLHILQLFHYNLRENIKYSQ